MEQLNKSHRRANTSLIPIGCRIDIYVGLYIFFYLDRFPLFFLLVNVQKMHWHAKAVA